MTTGWTGSKVKLVPLDKARHLENALLWLNDPEVTQWLLIGHLPLSRIAEEEYFEKFSNLNESDVAFAIETMDGKHIGFSGVHNINHRHGVGFTGTVIGDKTAWKNGYGSDSVQVRTRYCFDVLGLRLLRSEVMTENEASIKMLKKVGYVECGRVPRVYWQRGAFRDVVVLACHREES